MVQGISVLLIRELVKVSYFWKGAVVNVSENWRGKYLRSRIISDIRVQCPIDKEKHKDRDPLESLFLLTRLGDSTLYNFVQLNSLKI